MTAREQLLAWRGERESVEKDLAELRAELPDLLRAGKAEFLSQVEMAKLTGYNRATIAEALKR